MQQAKIPCMNNTYNKIVRKTQGKLLEETMRREHFKQVANRYFSLCYDAEVKKQMIDNLSFRINSKAENGVEDQKSISVRKKVYEKLRMNTEKQKISKTILERMITKRDDIRILREKANEAYEQKDMDVFLCEFNKVFLHGALFGIAIWCIDAFITVLTFGSIQKSGVGSFLKEIFDAMPIEVLIATGASFIYHISKYSEISELMEIAHDEVGDFINYVESKLSRSGKI